MMVFQVFRASLLIAMSASDVIKVVRLTYDGFSRIGRKLTPSLSDELRKGQLGRIAVLGGHLSRLIILP